METKPDSKAAVAGTDSMTIKIDNNMLIAEKSNKPTFIFSAILLIIGIGIIVYFINATEQWPAIFGVVIVPIAIYFMLTTKMLKLTIDKPAGKFNYSEKTLLAGKTGEAQISKIKEVQLKTVEKTSVGRYGATDTYYYYYLVFEMSDQEAISLYFGISSSASLLDFSIPIKTNMHKIADFLGMELKEVS